MKAYTDIEQSKKLAEFLPLESADMCYPLPCENGDKPLLERGKFGSTPCWSFAALLALLPLPTLEETPITDTETKWQCTIYCGRAKYWTELYNEPIDALIDAILITKENN